VSRAESTKNYYKKKYFSVIKKYRNRAFMSCCVFFYVPKGGLDKNQYKLKIEKIMKRSNLFRGLRVKPAMTLLFATVATVNVSVQAQGGINSENYGGAKMVVTGKMVNTGELNSAIPIDLRSTNGEDSLRNTGPSGYITAKGLNVSAGTVLYNEAGATINVEELPPFPTSFTGTPSGPLLLDLVSNVSAQVGVSVLAPAGSDQGVTYTSEDDAIATVSATGLVEAVSSGSITITIASVVIPSIKTTVEVYVAGAGKMVDHRDNKEYVTSTFGTTTWMTENLAYEIPIEEAYFGGSAAADGVDVDASQPRYWTPNHVAETSAKFTTAWNGGHIGYLYNWAAMMGLSKTTIGNNISGLPSTTGICPDGWRIATPQDMTELRAEMTINYMDYSTGLTAGQPTMENIAKAILTPTSWNGESAQGKSKSTIDGGFNYIGCGFMWASGDWSPGLPDLIFAAAHSDDRAVIGITLATTRDIDDVDNTCGVACGWSKENGFSVRCVR
jgi:uncharacterized protein (TIGR02145 family)